MAKICHFSTVHKRYDTRILLKECSYLTKNNHKVFLFISDGNGNEVYNNVNIIDIGLSTKKWNTQRLKRFFYSSFRILKAILKSNYDYYHFHDPELIFIGYLLKLLGKKVIYDIHEDISLQISQKTYIPNFLKKTFLNVFCFFENYFASRFYYLVTATPSIKERFKAYNNNIICVNNYPIIDELKLKKTVKKEKAICFVGWMTFDRGIYQLVKAVEGLDIKLHLVGKIWHDYEEKELRKLDGWSNVIYHGTLDRKSVAEILSKSMAGIVTFLPKPNHMNCQPNKLFEYMSAGLPVIASNFKNIIDLVEKNKIGYCIDPTDFNQLRMAIEKIIYDPDQSKNMGNKAYKLIINQFNWENEFLKLNKIYS